MKTLVYSIHGFDKPFLEAAAAEKHVLHYTELALNIDSAQLAEGFEAVILFTSDIASAEVLEKLHQAGVRYLALRSVGYDHVDLKKAKVLGMRVANVPAYSPFAIAEHSVAMLLALNRKIVLSQKRMAVNDFRLDDLVGFDLNEKTVGVVGSGKIGAAFIRIMHGFGCKIVAYDVAPDEDLIQSFQVKYTSLNELCAVSDVISVSCPLNAETQYMFRKDTFAKMKKGVIFINTARGAIVNTVDLMEALDQGIIAYAGLDVYEYEKPIFFYDHTHSNMNDDLFEKLRAYPNVLITGHQAFLTREALQAIASISIDNLSDWEQKGMSSNEL
ncbi:MAG: 2-hydroxyacid dehydrogenase [Bacteroidota bacterium]|nr:2-hydroxyacid dehydrogenase [Bacteroidota bacterium]